MKWILLLLASVLACYGPEIAPYYVYLFHPNELKILGPITQYEVPCSEPPQKSSFCSHEYLIPRSVYDTYSHGALGGGQILSATVYECAEDPSGGKVIFDDPANPGRLHQTLKTYQTVDLDQLHCSNGPIRITAWSVPGALRSGFDGGAASIGSVRSIERVKFINEFFTVGFIQLLGSIYILLFVFSKMLSRVLGAKQSLHIFERHLWAWFGFIITTSGLLQIAIPVTQFSNIFDRIGCFFSLLCRISVFLAFLQEFRSNKRISSAATYLEQGFFKSKFLPKIALLPLAIVIAPKFYLYFGPTLLTLGLIAALSSLFSHNVLMICFSAAVLLESLKIVGVKHLPQSQVATVFVALTLLLEVFRRFKTGSSIVKFAQQLRSLNWNTSQSIKFKSVLQTIADQIGCSQVSMFSVLKAGGCRIWQLVRTPDGRIIYELYDRDDLPPFFAHISSTGQALIHLDDRSPLAQNIRRGRPPAQAYSSHYQCNIPVFGESQVIGGLSLTGYPDSWAMDSDKTAEIETTVQLLQPSITEILISENLQCTSAWSESVRACIEELNSLQVNLRANEAKPTSETFQQCIDTIVRRFDAYGYIARLDQETRLFTILGIEGYPEVLSNILTSGKLFALKENEQGPLALAINRRQVIVSPDVTLLRNVLHKNTNDFFAFAGTKSCAAVPIFNYSEIATNSDSPPLWGILFLERKTNDRFTLQNLRGLEQISRTISGLLVDVDSNEELLRARTIISSFLPHDVLKKVLYDGMDKQSDYGYLLKLDLRGSSIISDRIKHGWSTATVPLIEQIRTTSELHNLKLVEFEWDSGLFTLSASEPDPQKVKEIVLFCRALVPLIDDWYKTNFAKIIRENFGNDPRLGRFCVSFGDITRGFTKGPNRRWSFIESEIALNNKLESECKSLGSVIYADGSITKGLDLTVWKSTGKIVPASNREIFEYIETWQELLAKEMALN